MERSKEYQLAKWLSRRIFLMEGNLIPIGRFFGWKGFHPLSYDEHKLVERHKSYMDEMLESGVVEILEGPQNPMSVKKYVDAFAMANGKMVGEEFKKVYVPDDPNLITIVIKDHVGLMRPEKRDDKVYSSKKEIIDLASADDRRFRDRYGFTIVNVSQFNREISNPIRLKSGSTEPMLEDFKESGATQEDADVVLSLFDPYRYKVSDPAGYDLEKLRQEDGTKKYRYVSVLKNSYGADGVGIGLAFEPTTGTFKELPRRDKILDTDYQSIIDNGYFLR